MATPAKPAAPDAAPDAPSSVTVTETTGHPRTSLEALLEAAKNFLPALAVSVALPIVLLHEMPASNEKIALSLISGLLGFLTGRATNRRSAS